MAPTNAFSLDQLSDRVVIMALFEQIVTEEQVEAAWQQWQGLRRAGSQEPLWRTLLASHKEKQDRIYDIAAKSHAFEEIDLVPQRARLMLREVASALGYERFKRLLHLSLLPVSIEHPEKGDVRFVVGTHDPLRSGIPGWLRQLGLEPFTLRYLPLPYVNNLIASWHDLEYQEYIAERVQETRWTVMIQGLAEATEPAAGETAADARTGIVYSFLTDLIEGALVTAVQRAEEVIHFVTNAEGRVEVYQGTGERFELWKVETDLPFSVVLAYIENTVLKLDRQAYPAERKGIIARWIHDKLYRFEVAIKTKDKASGYDRYIVVNVLY